jgi:hypothetical protein
MISGMGTPGGSARFLPEKILSVSIPERKVLDEGREACPGPVGVEAPFAFCGILAFVSESSLLS